MSPPLGSHVLHRITLGKHDKLFLSETTRTKAMILGMQHHPVYLYEVGSNYTSGACHGGHMFYRGLYIGKTL